MAESKGEFLKYLLNLGIEKGDADKAADRYGKAISEISSKTSKQSSSTGSGTAGLSQAFIDQQATNIARVNVQTGEKIIAALSKTISLNPIEIAKAIISGGVDGIKAVIADITNLDKELIERVKGAGGYVGSTAQGMMDSTREAMIASQQFGVATNDTLDAVKDLMVNSERMSMYNDKTISTAMVASLAFAKNSRVILENAENFRNVGLGLDGAAKSITDIGLKSVKVGLSAKATTDTLVMQLGKLNQFGFQGGIAGLAKLSVEATRLKLDMQGIAGMAEKVFRPEGAIEMAAQLTTMGGEFAKLGDPMTLLFKSRNDMAGFSKDVGKASAEFIEFNKETGEFNIKAGLAADRMREISTITGIAVEELKEMGSAQLKIVEVGKNLKSGIFGEEDTQLISSFAKFKDGKWKIEAGSFSKDLKDLNKNDIARIKAEDKTLQERAEFGRSFDETIQDLILMVKEMLLPLAKSLRENFGERVKELAKWFNSSEFRDMVEGVIKGVGDFIKYISDFMKNNPITAAVTAGAAIFGGSILKYLGESAMWLLNGKLLGMGFNSVASGGGGGGGSMLDMLDMGDGKGKGKSGKMGRFGKIGKFLKGPGGAGLLAGGFAAYDEYSENAATGMSGGENAGRTVSKGGGAMGGAAAGAAMGAIGGPVGVLLGGIIGGIAGSALGEEIGDAIWGNENATAVSAGRGKNKAGDFKSVGMQDGIMFHPQDKFLKVNDAITIAGTQAGGNAKLAEKMGNGGSSNETTHKFNDLNIKISVDAPSDSKFWESIVNQPDIMKKITQGVHISSEEASSGGKVTGSGPKRRGK